MVFPSNLSLIHILFLDKEDFSFTDQELEGMSTDTITTMLFDKAAAVYGQREETFGSPIMRELERVVMLRVVDEYWMEHISAMDELRRGINQMCIRDRCLVAARGRVPGRHCQQ